MKRGLEVTRRVLEWALMRLVALLTLALTFSVGIYLLGSRIAHKKAEVRAVNNKNEVLNVRDLLGERFPEHPVYLTPGPTLCAENVSVPGMIRVGCGVRSSGPEELALRTVPSKPAKIDHRSGNLPEGI